MASRANRSRVATGPGPVVIGTHYLGGHRIIVHREPPARPNPYSLVPAPSLGYVCLRVFAGGTIDRYPSGRSLPTAHGGPRVSQRMEVPDLDLLRRPDFPAIIGAIQALHRRWPRLRFHDCTGLDLAALFAAPEADSWVPSGADDLSDL